MLRRLTGHTGPVGAVAWGQLGDRPVLARDADEGTVRLWDPVIERFADRLPGYRSDDPTDPDRLGRDAEAATLAVPITDPVGSSTVGDGLISSAVRRNLGPPTSR